MTERKGSWWLLLLLLSMASMVTRTAPSPADATDHRAPPTRSVRDAAQRGDADAVRALLDAGADLEAEDPWQETALFAATQNGDLQTLQLLLDRGADPNHRNRRGQTPLMFAVWCEDGRALEMIDRLLRAGADVDAKDEGGSTALNDAAGKIDPHLVRILLDAGADPNAYENYRGWAPLLHSLFPYGDEAVHVEVLRLLLASGADPNARGRGGGTALMNAVGRVSPGIVGLLLDYRADPNLTNDDGSTPLMLAVRKGYLGPGTAEVVRRLIAAGADPNARNKAGMTATAVAVSSGNTDVLPLLNAMGARDAAASLGPVDTSRALEQAVRSADAGRVRALIAGHVDPNTPDENGRTPLINAAANENLDILDALLAADNLALEARSPGGSTALLWAVRRRKVQAVERLLRAGADVRLRNARGDTPILLAARYELIEEIHYANGAVRLRDREVPIARMLLEHGADPNDRDPDGLTPLMFAAGQGRRALVELLLAHEADVNAKASYGITARQLATGLDVIALLRAAR
jgi:ankyrin repeat protein